jgi:hypothetical protein
VIDQIIFLLLVSSEKPCICGFPNLYGPYVDTAGKNAQKIQEYIRHQLDEGKTGEQLTMGNF